MQPIFEEAARLLERGEPFVLNTVVGTKGSTPQKPGAKLLVRRDGSAVGTLGGGCVEADVWAEAKSVLEERGGAQVREFVLNEELAAQDGLVCGGTMEILIDPLEVVPELRPLFKEILEAHAGKGDRALVTLVKAGTAGKGKPGAKLFVRADGSRVGSLGSAALDEGAVALAKELMPKGEERFVSTKEGAQFYIEAFTMPPTVVIAGGGHVGKAVYEVAKPLGFRVEIVDDRPQFANRERFPEGDEVIVSEFSAWLSQLNITPNSFIVIATRGHKFDDVALGEAVKSRAGYIGLVGSRRKSILIYRDLLKAGVSKERLKDVHAPVGLDLGGRTPEEIAISILAEILMIRYGRDGRPMKMDSKLIDKAAEVAARPSKKLPMIMQGE